MKGAMAELWAKMTRTPKSNNTRTIGVSHHHLFCQKNRSSSPAMPNRLDRFSLTLMGATSSLAYSNLLHHTITKDKTIHAALGKRVKGLIFYSTEENGL